MPRTSRETTPIDNVIDMIRSEDRSLARQLSRNYTKHLQEVRHQESIVQSPDECSSGISRAEQEAQAMCELHQEQTRNTARNELVQLQSLTLRDLLKKLLNDNERKYGQVLDILSRK